LEQELEHWLRGQQPGVSSVQPFRAFAFHSMPIRNEEFIAVNIKERSEGLCVGWLIDMRRCVPGGDVKVAGIS
jgi:hypothetical protein